MGYTAEHELEINNDILKHIPRIKTVFDVGARDDINYLTVKPNATFHLFEPNPVFFKGLQDKVASPKVYLNNFGLGHIEGEFGYVNGSQSFHHEQQTRGDQTLPIRRLDKYLKERRLKGIDFLKIDTEGFDHQVLAGLGKYVTKVKYVYYEVWNDQEVFKKLLKGFDIELVGYRNYLCRNKKLVPQKTWDKIVKYLRSKKYAELV